MRRTTVTLGALLGASLVVNAAFFARMSRERAGAPSSQPPPLSPRSGGEDSPLLREELQEKTQKLEELRARIEGLEAEKNTQALSLPVLGADPLLSFRDKIRRMKKFPPEAKESAEAQLERTALETEFQRFLLRRSKDAHAYAECLKIFYQEALAGTELPLSPEQQDSLAKILGELEQGMGHIQAESTGERLIREFELDSTLYGKMRELLGPDQQNSIEEGPLSSVLSTGYYSTSYYSRRAGAQQVASSWQSDYGLDESQMPLLKTVAQSYIDAMARLDSQGPISGAPMPEQRHPEAYRYRISALREQMAALRILEPALTPEQRARIRNGEIREMFFLNDH